MTLQPDRQPLKHSQNLPEQSLEMAKTCSESMHKSRYQTDAHRIIGKESEKTDRMRPHTTLLIGSFSYRPVRM